jgi:hypothetical protein
MGTNHLGCFRVLQLYGALERLPDAAALLPEIAQIKHVRILLRRALRRCGLKPKPMRDRPFGAFSRPRLTDGESC